MRDEELIRSVWSELHGGVEPGTSQELLSTSVSQLLKYEFILDVKLRSSIVCELYANPSTDPIITRTGDDLSFLVVATYLDALKLMKDSDVDFFPKVGSLFSYKGSSGIPDEIRDHALAEQIIFMLGTRYGLSHYETEAIKNGQLYRFNSDEYGLKIALQTTQERDHYILSGKAVRFFGNKNSIIGYEFPIHEKNEYAQRFETRLYRDHASKLAVDIDIALRYLALVDKNKWSYGEIRSVSLDKKIAFIGNGRDNLTYFHFSSIVDKKWQPEVGERVRFRCNSVEREASARRTPYSSNRVELIDYRIDMERFLDNGKVIDPRQIQSDMLQAISYGRKRKKRSHWIDELEWDLDD